MLALTQWLSHTAASEAIRTVDWLIPLLQTIHILAIAMVVSSLLMIDLRILRATHAQLQSIADTAHRFEPWIWSGLAVLAASGATLIVAEPQRTLPNAVFQIKILLLVLAVTTTCALRMSLRRDGEFRHVSGSASGAAKLLAIGAFILWCTVAAAGRFNAYTQPI